MPTSHERQKQCEKRMLEAARRACPLIPSGDIEILSKPGQPDLMITASTGEVAVEVTELPGLKGENPFPPVQDESFHQEVVRLAEEKYHADHSAQPVSVVALFLDDAECKRKNPEGWRRLTDRKTGPKRDKMARSLAQFVEGRPVPPGGSLTFTSEEMAGQTGGDTLPAGFASVSIFSTADRWRWMESPVAPPPDRELLAAVIARKNGLLPRYRAECPGIPTWLLIYIRVEQGFPMPLSLTESRYAFDFERVLLYSDLDKRLFEIARG